MKKMMLIVCGLFLAACEREPLSEAGSSWAVVDELIVKDELYKRLYSREKEVLYEEKLRALSKELHILRIKLQEIHVHARKQCQSVGEDTVDPFSGLKNVHKTVVVDPGGSLGGAAKTTVSLTPRGECIESYKETNGLDKLEAKIQEKAQEKVDVAGRKEAYLNGLQNDADQMLPIVVSTYAEDRFELVISKNTKRFYNKVGTVVDITDKVVGSIDLPER